MESSTSEVELLKSTVAQLMISIENLMKERNDSINQTKEALLIKRRNENLQKEYSSLSQLHTQSLEKAKHELNRLQSENKSITEHLETLINQANVFRPKFDELGKLAESLKIKNASLDLENRRLKGKLKETVDIAMTLGGDLNKCVDGFRKLTDSFNRNPRVDSPQSLPSVSTIPSPASLPVERRRPEVPGLTNGGIPERTPVDRPTEAWKCAFCNRSGFCSEETYLKHVEHCQ